MGFSLDDLASYQTPRVAKIKDRRLGLLWYGGCSLVILYIVGYAYLFEKEYLLLEPPLGAVRTSAMSPRDVNSSYENPTPDQLPYCRVPGRDSFNGFPTYPCLYFDQDLAVFPIGEDSAISLSTRLTNDTVELEGCTAFDSNCPWTPVDDEADNFIANVENFTIMIEHSFTATEVGYTMKSSTDLSGRIVNRKGKKMETPSPNRVGEKGETDIMTVSLLLEAAGIDSLDDESLATENRSIRDDGIVILVFITYSNTFTYNTYKTRYEISAIPQPTKFKVEQPIYLNEDSILRWNRHGIKFIFIQAGLLGAFDFSVFLLTFISGIGLVAVCSVFVDMLAVYLVPQKDLYYKYKYLESPELEDIRQDANSYASLAEVSDVEKYQK
eukprot:CAMPEP_0201488856 /NCGR_PEP_ID=MMETSP0151_2-20130828/19886_1 /ASSEMBLY_ACC=CAM_ASM_000257 /TAXON_ID=200890 /ORGANISM="Paramoeba atlantica, Strain 621/1 / CCAP 1560/9" /LENGTH=382 /DNA_ID=CAMNT_0047874245 /DNA_START=96 /DNA_END=1244 /DNA_ORIENTATION=+